MAPQPVGGDALYRPTRRSTRVVRVGAVEIGGDFPIRVQSMTNTDTMDTQATVAQTIRLAEAGCEIVRVTAPSIRDAENLRLIRQALREARVDVPLVADIHFTPNAAMIAAEIVEKVRINPGNYADKKRFEVREYDDAEYAAEIERVQERFRPLVRRCRDNGVAMRIGTNHGSLSDRIMNRFGDTPEGMVESALEFLDVCEDERYHEVIFSMKASNTQVAIQAYRLLAARLERRAPGEPSYPFHVGVTEAGDAEDGRIKSAIGIGALLEDGIGDTIRVSLTEDPVREVPVARSLVRRAARVAALRRAGTDTPIAVSSSPIVDSLQAARRSTSAADWGGLVLGGGEPVRVELEVSDALEAPAACAARLAIDLAGLRDVEVESLLLGVGDASRVGIFLEELASLGLEVPVSLRVDMGKEGSWPGQLGAGRRWVACVSPGVSDAEGQAIAALARAHGAPLEWELAGEAHELPARVRQAWAWSEGEAAAFSLVPEASLHDYRVLVAALADAGAEGVPVVLRQRLVAEDGGQASPASLGSELPSASAVPHAGGRAPMPRALSEEGLIDASVRLGGLLCDGIGDMVSLRSEVGAAAAVDLGYRVLQGARQRTTRTEYISCPSCGRTLFDLEETTARIKSRTDHLNGVKIAVMGCIVNGPGEMADADFGYVGSGVGQVTLYVGKEVVARAVPEAEATDRLVELIRENDRWVEAGQEGSTEAGEEAVEAVEAATSRPSS